VPKSQVSGLDAYKIRRDRRHRRSIRSLLAEFNGKGHLYLTLDTARSLGGEILLFAGLDDID